MKRINIKAILADPAKRRELMVATIQATQAREGIDTTKEQAERAYDHVKGEIMNGDKINALIDEIAVGYKELEEILGEDVLGIDRKECQSQIDSMFNQLGRLVYYDVVEEANG